jgi:RNA polymerase sigma factor (sigma-70 family)
VIPDAELLDAWRSGQGRAGQILFERYFDALDRFFRNKVGEEAPDLVQKTFLGCLEGVEGFRGEGSFRSWLFSIAYRQLQRHYRNLARNRVDFDVRTSCVQDFGPTPGSVVDDEEQHRALLEALRRIPVEFQVALELHYWEEMSDADIGRALDVPLGTVKSRIRRGRLMLVKQLDELGHAAPLHATATELESWAEQLRELALGSARR